MWYVSFCLHYSVLYKCQGWASTLVPLIMSEGELECKIMASIYWMLIVGQALHYVLTCRISAHFIDDETGPCALVTLLVSEWPRTMPYPPNSKIKISPEPHKHRFLEKEWGVATAMAQSMILGVHFLSFWPKAEKLFSCVCSPARC